MTALYTDQDGKKHQLNINVLVKNERVVVCRVSTAINGPYFLHYHNVTGWKDLDHGETLLSRQMPFIVENPFNMHN